MSKLDRLLLVVSAVVLTALVAILAIDFATNGSQIDYLRMFPWNW